LVRIADFGQAVKGDRFRIGQEGDSRYLAAELLDSNPMPTAACDIFSLGMLLFEAATSIHPPRSGELWRELRCGNAYKYLTVVSSNGVSLTSAACDPTVVQDVASVGTSVAIDDTRLASEVQTMILRAMHPDPAQRPTAAFMSLYFAPGLSSPRASVSPPVSSSFSAFSGFGCSNRCID
jgi:serine/threonine protein kinase